MAISLVQGNARGTASSGNTISVTLAQTPTQGNKLIAAIVANQTGGTESVSSITQTGVTWNRVVQINPVACDEIWIGDVGSDASTSVTVTLAQSVYAAIADICEWSGLASNPVDQTATMSGTTTTQTSTGTTSTTTQADELWIGTIGVYDQAQSDPTNSFTMLDGELFTVFGGVSQSYLYKIVSSTGTANTGTTIGTSSNAWQGCIATFKAATGGGTDLTVTGNLTVNGSTTAEEGLTSNDTIYNKGYYNLIDTNGSTWINAMLTASTAPDSDFHFVPNYSTQSQGTSKVYFGYNSNWGSYHWMYGRDQIEGITTLMTLHSSGLLGIWGPVGAHGGTSSVPGLWFTTGAPPGASWGGSLGIGLNNANEIVLNANKLKLQAMEQ